MEFCKNGFTFKIDFTFFFILAFILIFGYNDALYVLLFSSLHELGHLLGLLILKKYPDHMKLSFYGFAVGYSCPLSIAQELFVLLAGPAVNLIGWIAFNDNINMILFLLNIFPVYPLDGGRCLKLIFEKLFSDRVSEAFFKTVSITALSVLLILSVFLLVLYHNITLFFICIYLIIFCYNNYF